MNNFKSVFLGFADSDTEAERNPQMFASSFFDPDNNIEELLNGYKYIVSGRKGDGKSAYSAKISLLVLGSGETDHTESLKINHF